MGKIAIVQATERDPDGALNVQIDGGGKNNLTAEHFADAGDDSCPLPNDAAAVADSVATGTQQATGYHDTQNAGQSEPGEKRIYSRELDGTPAAEVWLKADGSILIKCLKADAPIRIVSTGSVTLDSPDVNLSDSAGKQVACVGDLVAVIIPPLANSGGPVLPTPPTAVTPSGGIVASGQIISGRPKVKG